MQDPFPEDEDVKPHTTGQDQDTSATEVQTGIGASMSLLLLDGLQSLVTITT